MYNKPKHNDKNTLENWKGKDLKFSGRKAEFMMLMLTNSDDVDGHEFGMESQLPRHDGFEGQLFLFLHRPDLHFHFHSQDQLIRTSVRATIERNDVWFENRGWTGRFRSKC